MEPIVIIGTGQAGYTLAREFRKLDSERPLTLITEDNGANYYKPNLSKAFAAGKTPPELVMNPREAMEEQLAATILANTRVNALDAGSRRLQLEDRELSYHRLVLAVGADALLLPVSGGEKIPTVNSLDDYERFRAGLVSGCEVVVIGAGLIGCEFANDLAAAGYQVTVVDQESWPLARLAPREVGEAIKAGLSGLSVRWHFDARIESVDADGKQVRLADGTELRADAVLCAIGQRPRARLAEEAGLEVGIGIRVDEHLRTSDPNIFALGDCAEIDGRVRPFVLPITHSARALAKTLAGTDTAVSFPPMPIVVKTPACPTVVLPAEVPHSEGWWRVTGEGTDLEALYCDAEGRLHGFALTGAATAKRMELAKAIGSILDAAGA